MQINETVTELVHTLNQQTLLAEAAEAKIRELRGKLLEIMQESGSDKIETPYGKALVIESKSFDYSGFEEITATKKLLDTLKERVQEEAPVTVTPGIRFYANRGYEAPEIKVKPEKKMIRVYRGRVTRRRSSAEQLVS